MSIVSPNGSRIAHGEKTLEIRSWEPDLQPGEDLLIIENTQYLLDEAQTDPNGKPVALVKIKNVREYLKKDILAACATRWNPGYYSWELYI